MISTLTVGQLKAELSKAKDNQQIVIAFGDRKRQEVRFYAIEFLTQSTNPAFPVMIHTASDMEVSGQP